MPQRLGRRKQKVVSNTTSYFLVREPYSFDDEGRYRPVELHVGAILGRNVSAFSKDLKQNRLDIGILRIADGVSRECFEVLDMSYNGLRMLVNPKAKNKMEFLVDGLKFNAISGTEQVLSSGDKIVFDAFCKPPLYTYTVRHASEIDFTQYSNTTTKKKKRGGLISKMLKRNRNKKSNKSAANIDQKPTYIIKKEPIDYFNENEEGSALVSVESAYSSDSPYISDGEKMSVKSSSVRSGFSSASDELDERIRRSSQTSSLSSGHFLESSELYSSKGSMDYEDEDDMQFDDDDDDDDDDVWDKEQKSNAYVPVFPQKYQTLTKEAHQIYPRPHKELESPTESKQSQNQSDKKKLSDFLNETDQSIDKEFQYYSNSISANYEGSRTSKLKANRDEHDRRTLPKKDLREQRKQNSNKSLSSTKGHSRNHVRDSKRTTNPRSVFAKSRAGQKNSSAKKLATLDLITRRLEDPNRKSLTRSKSQADDASVKSVDVSVKSVDVSVKSVDVSVKSVGESVKSIGESVRSEDVSVASQDLSVASKKRVQRMRAAQQLYPNGKPVASGPSNLRKSYSQYEDDDDSFSDYDDMSVLSSASIESRDTVTVAAEPELYKRKYDVLLKAHLKMEKKHSQRSIVDTLNDLDSEPDSQESSENLETKANESSDIASNVIMKKKQNDTSNLPPSIMFDLQNSRERLKSKRKLQSNKTSTQQKMKEPTVISNQPPPDSVSKTLKNVNSNVKSPPKVDIHTHSIVESILYKKKVSVKDEKKSDNEFQKKPPTNTLQTILNQSMIMSNVAHDERDIRVRSVQKQANETLPKKEKIVKHEDTPIKRKSKDTKKEKNVKDKDIPVKKKEKNDKDKGTLTKRKSKEELPKKEKNDKDKGTLTKRRSKEELLKKEKNDKDKGTLTKRRSREELLKKEKIEKNKGTVTKRKSREELKGKNVSNTDKVPLKKKMNHTNKEGIDPPGKKSDETEKDDIAPQKMESSQTETVPTAAMKTKSHQTKKDEHKKNKKKEKNEVAPLEKESYPTKKDKVLPVEKNMDQGKENDIISSENKLEEPPEKYSNQIKTDNAIATPLLTDTMSPISVMDLESNMNKEVEKNNLQHIKDQNNSLVDVDSETSDDDAIDALGTFSKDSSLSKEAEMKEDENELQMHDNEEASNEGSNISGSFDRLLEFAASPGQISLGEEVYEDLSRVKKLNDKANKKMDIVEDDNYQQKEFSDVNIVILDDGYDQLDSVQGDSQDDLYDLTSESSTSDNFDDSSGSYSTSSSVSDLSASIMSVDEYIDAQNMYSIVKPDHGFHGSDSSSNSPAREYRRRVDGDIKRSRGVMAYRDMTTTGTGNRKYGHERFKFLEDIYVGDDDESIVSSLCLSEQQNFEDIASMDFDDEKPKKIDMHEVKEKKESKLLKDYDGSEINSESLESGESLVSNTKSIDKAQPFLAIEWNKILDGFKNVFSPDNKGKEKGDSQSKSALSIYSTNTKTSVTSKKSRVSWADESLLTKRDIRKKSRVPSAKCNFCVWTDQIKQHYKPKLSQGFS